MIRFSCPTCRKVLKSPDHGVGRKTFCPRCGQRLLIPSPIPIQVQNKTILGQPTPDSAASFIAPSAPSQLPPELSDLDSIATLGLRKDAASEGEVQQQQSYSLARSRAGTVFAALAIMLGIAAVPVSIASDQVYGPALAGLGVLLGILGMFTAVLCGRGSGFGLSLVVTAVCASALWGVLRLISSEGNLNDDILDRLLTSSAPDSEMMEYLPSNCQIIVCVRPGRVAGSEAFRELSRRFPEIGRLETDVEETIGLPPSGLTRFMVGGSEDSDGFVGVCRTNGPVSAADILANMKDSKFREEKVGKYTIHTKNKASFCVAQKDLILFGPSTTIQETLLRKGPPELSTGLQTAIRAADFSKGVVTVANAKDILRKGSRLDSTRIAGLSQELADAVIRATAAGVLEITFGKAIEWRVQVCCKDAATARELKKLNDEANTKAEADPNTSKQDLKILASERWSQDESRLIGTGKIDVETVVELIDQYRKKESQRADQERFKLNIGHNRKEEQHPKKGVR